MKISIRDEFGKSTLWAMLLCIFTLGYYLKSGRAFLEASMPPYYHTIIILMLAVVTIFTVGCSIQMMLAGDPSNGTLKRKMRAELEEYSSFIDNSVMRIRDLEQGTLNHSQRVSPRAIDSLALAKRILNAMQTRVRDINELIERGSQLDLIDAHELFEKDLEIVENCLDSLIGADPVPPLKPDSWVETVEGLILTIDNEMQRVAA